VDLQPILSAATGGVCLLLTKNVHQNDIAMLTFISVLFGVAAFTGRIFAYWFDLVIRTIPKPPDTQEAGK
jgi:hypothetical protein